MKVSALTSYNRHTTALYRLWFLKQAGLLWARADAGGRLQLPSIHGNPNRCGLVSQVIYLTVSQRI
jgi:hypothetical protein